MLSPRLESRFVQVSVAVFLLLALFSSLGALYALKTVLDKQEAILVADLNEIIVVQKLISDTERQVSHYRAFLLTGDNSFAEHYRESEREGNELLAELYKLLSGKENQSTIKKLRELDQQHDLKVKGAFALRRQHGQTKALIDYFETELIPARRALSEELDRLQLEANEELKETKNITSLAARKNLLIILISTSTGLLFIFSVVFFLYRRSRIQARDLAKLNQELDEFSAIASHDLKAPLRTISLSLEMLKRDVGSSLTKESLEYINYCVDAAKRLSQLIEKLLSYARTGNQAEDFGPVNLNEVFSVVILNLGAIIKEKSATVVKTSLPTVYGNRLQLVELLQNLISNALKYQQPSVPPHIEVNATNSSGGWEISVKDNGRGFEQSESAGLFNPFTRLRSSEGTEGSGLGLSLCRKIVEKHGGYLWAESEPNKGSIFHFELPGKLADASI